MTHSTETIPSFRHHFRFAGSPDVPLDLAQPQGFGYVIRHAVNGEEKKPLFVSAAADSVFSITAPLGSLVNILLYARDGHGHTSQAVPFEFTVTGKRIIRPPGGVFAPLAMTSIETAGVSLPVLAGVGAP